MNGIDMYETPSWKKDIGLSMTGSEKKAHNSNSFTESMCMESFSCIVYDDGCTKPMYKTPKIDLMLY